MHKYECLHRLLVEGTYSSMTFFWRKRSFKSQIRDIMTIIHIKKGMALYNKHVGSKDDHCE